MTILELADPRWHDFVAGHPEATPFHHPDWAQLVADCYGFRAFAFAMTDAGGAVEAGMPVVVVRHLLGARRWASLPFTDHCPPLRTSAGGDTELVDAIEQAATAEGVAMVEVRAPLAGASPFGAPALRHVLDLAPDPATIHAGFHPSQVQRNIRRAEREGLTVRTSQARDDVLGTFYRLHLRTRQRQGVPVQPRRFFRLLWERAIATGLGHVLIVEAAGRPVAAAVFLAWNGKVVYKFGASDAEAWSLRPNHLLFWHAIRTACERGDRSFDFGRTDLDNEGLAAFKRSWGAREEPLVYSAVGRTSTQASASHGTAGRLLGAAIRRGPLFVCRASGELLYRFVA